MSERQKGKGTSSVEQVYWTKSSADQEGRATCQWNKEQSDILSDGAYDTTPLPNGSNETSLPLLLPQQVVLLLQGFLAGEITCCIHVLGQAFCHEMEAREDVSADYVL